MGSWGWGRIRAGVGARVRVRVRVRVAVGVGVGGAARGLAAGDQLLSLPISPYTSPQVTSSASSREPASRAREPRPRRSAVSHEGR